MNDICKTCSAIKIWQEDMKKSEDEEIDYEPTCPCCYCALNQIG